MGKKSVSKYSSIQIGDQFNKWTVIGSPFIDRYAKVPCRCDCGTEGNIDAYTLTSNKSKSCIHCFNRKRHGIDNTAWKGYKEIPRSWFYRFQRYAKKNNKEFEIDITYIWNLYIKQDKKCALTNLNIDFTNERRDGEKYIGLKCTASLDRIDSSRGYVKDNIQLIHKDVNIMKNAYDQNYFIKMCKLIAEYNK